MVVLSVAGGCKPPAFVSRRTDNFTAYFNTFYNARKAYETGVEAARAEDRKVDRLRFMEVFASSPSTQTGREFESAILKSADVLRHHPASKWVDDALLLIGQSYFEQRNFVGAEQKFREVIELESSLEAEARFWLARSLIASDALVEAEEEIGSSLAEEGLERKWAAMLRLALGELRVREQDWVRAAADLAAGLERVTDKEVGARGQFLLGQVYERLGRYEEAMESYRSVDDFTPLYELSYAAKFSAVRVQGIHGDTRAALGALRRLERDDKHFGYRAELAYLRARIMQQEGRSDEAWQVYDELLYDPLYTALVNDLRGRIHYALGELYRDLDKNFVRAAAHFDTAAAQLRTQLTAGAQNRGAAGRPVSSAATRNAASDPELAPEAIVDAEKLKEAFGAFAKVQIEVARMDSLLALGRLDGEAYAARILEIRQQLAREAEAQRRLQAARQVQAAFARSAATGGDASYGQNLQNQGASGANMGNDPVNQAGFLFHLDPVRATEGKATFTQKWGDRPLVRNWRRIEAVSLAIAEGLDPAAEDEFATAAAETGDELPEVDESSIPRDSTSQARMMADLAKARYELANTLFLGISRPDSAATWYRLIIEETPKEAVAQRALYALAEVQQALGDQEAASGIFRRIIDETPDSEFAELGRSRLGLPSTRVELADTTELAEAAYDGAYSLWTGRAWEPAIDSLLTVAATYPETDIRPRSLLAVGSVFLEWSVADSLALDREIPMGVSDSVIARSGLASPPKPVVARPDSLVSTDSTAVGAAVVTTDSSRVSNPDSTAIAPPSASVDSLVVSPPSALADSLEVSPPSALVDSLEVSPPDSLLDRSLPPADSLLTTPPDSLLDRSPPTADSPSALADSLAATMGDPADELGAVAAPPVDSLAWRRIKLSDLLSRISTLFPGTPYADRATAMGKALAERLAPPPDSTLVVPGDSALVASADSAGVPVDSTVALVDSTRADPPVVEELLPDERAPWQVKESALIRPLDDAAGEWTGWLIVLQELTDLAAAPAVREQFEAQLSIFGTTEIVTGEDQGRTVAYLVLGRYETREEAEGAALQAGWAVPPSAWLLRVLILE